jgi:hypothetical protein
MSFVFSANNLYTVANAKVLYDFKQFMVSTGRFTVVASGDGVSNFSTSSDVITSGSSGAHGMSNVYAWYVLKEASSFAGSQRQWLFKVFYGSVAYFDVISSCQGFSTTYGRGSTGSSTVAISATNAPLAFDELFYSSGTFFPLSMNNVNFSQPSSYTVAVNYYANFGVNTTSGANSWFMFMCNGGPSAASMQRLIAYDQLSGYDSNNGDPAIYVCAGNSTTAQTRYNYSPVSTITQALTDPRIINIGAAPIKPYNMPIITASPSSGCDVGMPMYWAASTMLSSSTYTKETDYTFPLGQSSLFTLHYPSRVFSNTYTYNGNNYVMTDGIATSMTSSIGLIWNGSVPTT